MTNAGRKSNLPSCIRIAVPNRHANRAKIVNKPALLAVASLKKTQRPAFKTRCIGMAELKPQRPRAFVADLTSAQMRSVSVFPLRLIMSIDCLDRLRRHYVFKVHFTLRGIAKEQHYSGYALRLLSFPFHGYDANGLAT